MRESSCLVFLLFVCLLVGWCERRGQCKVWRPDTNSLRPIREGEGQGQGERVEAADKDAVSFFIGCMYSSRKREETKGEKYGVRTAHRTHQQRLGSSLQRRRSMPSR